MLLSPVVVISMFPTLDPLFQGDFILRCRHNVQGGLVIWRDQRPILEPRSKIGSFGKWMYVLKPNNLEQSQGVWNSPIALNKVNKLKIHDNNIWFQRIHFIKILFHIIIWWILTFDLFWNCLAAARRCKTSEKIPDVTFSEIFVYVWLFLQ